MRFSLRQLEVFAAVCRTGGVNAAAVALSMTQSAASQALAELESALDGPLFDRRGRRLHRNERGDVLYPAALELLERAAGIESALRGRGDAPAARVTLAASATIGSYLLPARLGRYLRAQPQAHVDLRVLNSEQVIAEVAMLRVDAGFIEGVCSHPDLVVEPWQDDVLCVIAAPDHPLAGRRRLTPALFAGQRWVLREPGSGTRETLERAAVAGGLPPLASVLTLGNAEAVQRAVIAGAGLGCLSRLAVAAALARREIVALKLPFLDLHRPLYRLRHRDKYQSHGLQAVLAACDDRRGPLGAEAQRLQRRHNRL